MKECSNLEKSDAAKKGEVRNGINIRRLDYNESKGADKTRTWSIAVYIRLSRDDGNEESESIVNQKKILDEYLERFFGEPYQVWDYYIDDGLSGTDDSRKAFMRMVDDIECGRVDCVLCKTLARAFRNYADQGYYLEYYFPRRGVRFISTGDPKVDTLKNPEGVMGLEVPITGLMNDRYAGKTSADVRRTFDTKRRRGEFIGAFAPYGYLKNPRDRNHLILDEEIVPIKRQMRDWILLDGLSLSAVAEKMNELGIPNPTAYKRLKGLKYSNPNSGSNDGLWSGTTVKRVLLNPVNLGHMVQGRQRVVSYKVHDRISLPSDSWFYVENTHEPTFTAEEYEQMAKVIGKKGKTVPATGKTHIFSGFIQCGVCKKNMERKSAKGYVYYACRTYGKKSRLSCTKHSMREDKIEKAVLGALKSQIVWQNQKAAFRSSQEKAQSRKSGYIMPLLAQKEEMKNKLSSILENLYGDWKNGDITREEYKEMKVHFKERRDKLSREIESLVQEKAATDRTKAAAEKMAEAGIQRGQEKGFKAWQELFFRLDRQILIQFIDRIYIHENNRVAVRFRFRNEFLKQDKGVVENVLYPRVPQAQQVQQEPQDPTVQQDPQEPTEKQDPRERRE